MAGDGVRTLFALVLALVPGLAHPHLVNTGLGPVYDAIVHFALSPEDWLAAVALAVLSGLRGKAHARCVVVALPLAWLVGGVAGDVLRVAPPDAIGWLPLVAVGLLVAADLRLSPSVTTAIALAVGAWLGFGNGAAMVQAAAGLRGIGGIVAIVFILTTLAAAAVVAWQSGWMRIAWRVSGSWIAAGGLLLLGWALR